MLGALGRLNLSWFSLPYESTQNWGSSLRTAKEAYNLSESVLSESHKCHRPRVCWNEAVPIYVENEFGKGVIPYLTNAFQEVNVRIQYWGVIPPAATDEQIASKLYELMTIQTSVSIVHMLLSLGSRLFAKTKVISMMAEGYVWIIIDVMTNSFG
ncbi:hypothetical protein ACFXTO_009224 [Malus domestica]